MWFLYLSVIYGKKVFIFFIFKNYSFRFFKVIGASRFFKKYFNIFLYFSWFLYFLILYKKIKILNFFKYIIFNFKVIGASQNFVKVFYWYFFSQLYVFRSFIFKNWFFSNTIISFCYFNVIDSSRIFWIYFYYFHEFMFFLIFIFFAYLQKN